MSSPLESAYERPDTRTASSTLSVLHQLPRSLREYRIIIATIKGDVGAINILQDALTISKELCVNNILVALGPTTPLSLPLPHGSSILWATFTDGTQFQNDSRVTVVPPNNLTDLSLNFDKLSTMGGGRIPLLLGDFLDNVLSVSTAPAQLYAFLCKLFTRIRTNEQTAFFLATEDMHHPTKTAVLRRFADVVIEYRSAQVDTNHRIETRITDHVENYYTTWNIEGDTEMERNQKRFLRSSIAGIGRQPNLLIKEAIAIPT